MSVCKRKALVLFPKFSGEAQCSGASLIFPKRPCVHPPHSAPAPPKLRHTSTPSEEYTTCLDQFLGQHSQSLIHYFNRLKESTSTHHDMTMLLYYLLASMHCLSAGVTGTPLEQQVPLVGTGLASKRLIPGNAYFEYCSESDPENDIFKIGMLLTHCSVFRSRMTSADRIIWDPYPPTMYFISDCP